MTTPVGAVAMLSGTTSARMTTPARSLDIRNVAPATQQCGAKREERGDLFGDSTPNQRRLRPHVRATGGVWRSCDRHAASMD
ncbi:MAG: hypothetical protein ACRENI_15115 [Gemmatimonadaceae bacterium]